MKQEVKRIRAECSVRGGEVAFVGHKEEHE